MPWTAQPDDVASDANFYNKDPQTKQTAPILNPSTFADAFSRKPVINLERNDPNDKAGHVCLIF
jgi:hypothetical protein